MIRGLNARVQVNLQINTQIKIFQLFIFTFTKIFGAHTKHTITKHIQTKHIKTRHIFLKTYQNITYQLTKHINRKHFKLQNISKYKRH